MIRGLNLLLFLLLAYNSKGLVREKVPVFQDMTVK